MSKRGRKPILTEDETRNIINNFVLKYGTTQEIKYVDLHNYCIELHQRKEITKIPSESYWRKRDRIGRKLIDEVNMALSHQLIRNENEHELQNLLNIIETKIVDKKLKRIIFNELKSKHNKIKELEKKININKNNTLILRKSYEDSKTLNKHQQDLISQIFHYLLNKSSNKNFEFFETALKSIFINPLDYLSILKQEKKADKNNISNFFKNRLK